jgi:GNAT superfamily N-acetyltransferase
MDSADYHLRPATLADADALVHHRIAMFLDMGVSLDPAPLADKFREWLGQTIPQGTYRAWVVEQPGGGIVAGGGMTIIPWPPGPRYLGDRLAFVYNMYTEPGHRGRGLARRIMAEIHTWCRAHGVTSLALNASGFGKPLYDSLGYVVTPSPMMFFALE